VNKTYIKTGLLVLAGITISVVGFISGRSDMKAEFSKSITEGELFCVSPKMLEEYSKNFL
jgi:hypothetical protein